MIRKRKDGGGGRTTDMFVQKREREREREKEEEREREREREKEEERERERVLFHSHMKVCHRNKNLFIFGSIPKQPSTINLTCGSK